MTYEFSMMLFLAAMVFTLIAQSRVSGNFKKYSQVRNQRGLTGEEAARKVLDANGLSDVTIEQIRGNLTDHYDPRTRVLRLSQGVYSIAVSYTHLDVYKRQPVSLCIVMSAGMISRQRTTVSTYESMESNGI